MGKPQHGGESKLDLLSSIDSEVEKELKEANITGEATSYASFLQRTRSETKSPYEDEDGQSHEVERVALSPAQRKSMQVPKKKQRRGQGDYKATEEYLRRAANLTAMKRYTEAANELLNGLDQCPGDVQLQSGFDESLLLIKLNRSYWFPTSNYVEPVERELAEFEDSDDEDEEEKADVLSNEWERIFDRLHDLISIQENPEKERATLRRHFEKYLDYLERAFDHYRNLKTVWVPELLESKSPTVRFAQIWQFMRDCKVPRRGLSLAAIDRIMIRAKSQDNVADADTLPVDDSSAEQGKEALRKVALFRGVSDAFIEKLSTKLQRYITPKNFTIVFEGTFGHNLFIIARGIVDVVTRDGKIIHTLESGDYFGEIAFLTSQPRTASIRTVTECDILSLSRDNTEDLERKYPAVFRKLEEKAEERLEDLFKKKQTLLKSHHDPKQTATIYEFVEGVVRVAFADAPHIPGLAERFLVFVTNKFMPNAFMSSLDSIGRHILSTDVKKIVMKYEGKMQKVFRYYCTVNTQGQQKEQSSSKNRLRNALNVKKAVGLVKQVSSVGNMLGALGASTAKMETQAEDAKVHISQSDVADRLQEKPDQTINFNQILRLFNDCEQIDPNLTTKKLSTVVKGIVLDNELAPQEHASNRQVEMTFGEFEELLLRCAFVKFSIKDNKVQDIVAKFMDSFFKSAAKVFPSRL